MTKNDILELLNKLNDTEIIMLNYEVENKLNEIKHKGQLANKPKETINNEDYTIKINHIKTSTTRETTTINIFNLILTDFFGENQKELEITTKNETNKEYHSITIKPNLQ